MIIRFFFIKHTYRFTSLNVKFSTGIKAAFFSFLFILSYWSCLGQGIDSEIRFDHLSNADGLSQNTVRTLLQDSRGFIWIGMEDGLNRYDGYKFKSYGFNSQNKSSNAFNFVNVLFEDHAKNIWIGTRSNGLYKYVWETELFESFLFDKDSASLLLTNSVTDVTEDNEGYLWVGTEKGLIKLDPKDGLYKQYLYDPDKSESISSNDILSLQIQENILWIGTRLGGLNKLDLDTEIFTRYSSDSLSSLQLISKTINSISVDKSSKLWLGTASGVEILDIKNRQVQILNKFIDTPVNSILFDSRNRIWLGSEGGLFLFDSLKDSWTHFYDEAGNPNSIKGSRISDIIEDNAGAIWIGTRFDGINKFDPVKHKFSSIRNNPNSDNSIPSNVIRCFWEDNKNRLWIGTPLGLTKFDRQQNLYQTFTHQAGDVNSLTHNDIRTIISDSKDNLWLGTRDGLSYYDTDKLTFKNFKYDQDNPNSLSGNHIRILLEDDKNLWIGTHNSGLNKLNKSTSTFTRYFGNTPDQSILDAKRITALFSDSQGSLWIGTSGNGVFKMVVDEKGNEQFIQYTINEDSTGLKTNIIKSFFEDDEENFWICTANGFCKMDREKGTFKTYLPQDGLANKMVYGIVQDDLGDLWMSTNNGLSRFNIYSEKFKNYYEHDGLQANEFNTNAFFKTKDGMLCFGGINGMNLFEPQAIKDFRFVSNIIIVDFQLFYQSQNPETGGFLDKHVSVLDEIILQHDQNIFSFEFVLLDYTNPEKNQYKYMMEGFDIDWSKSNSRNFATYTNLPAGDYTFKVLGSNGAGIWNEKAATIKLIISTPWWKSWWFISSMVLVFSSFISGFILVRQREFKRQNDIKNRYQEELENKVVERTNELEIALAKEKELNQMKINFVSMASHEFRTPLTSILSASDIIKRYYERLSKPDVIKKIDKIQTEVKHLTKILEDFLIVGQRKVSENTLKIEKVNIKFLFNEFMKDFINTTGSNHKIDYVFERSVSEVYLDSGLIRHIISNLLNNAIKYSGAGSVVQFKVSADNAFLKFQIKDEGIGIPEDDLKNIFDIFHRASNVGTVSGTGLGMAIVKQSVDLHGGQITIKSKEGVGTEIEVNIPIKK